MLVPLYGFLRGDVVGLLVLVQDHETVADAARRLREAASVRVAPDDRPAVVYAGERRLDPEATIAEAGLEALDRIDVHTASDVDSPSLEDDDASRRSPTRGPMP